MSDRVEMDVFTFLEDEDYGVVCLGMSIEKNGVKFQLRNGALNEEGEGYYIVNKRAEPVLKFEDASLICEGRVFISLSPKDIINGDSINYIVSWEPVSYFKNEWRALMSFFEKDILKACAKYLVGEEVKVYERN